VSPPAEGFVIPGNRPPDPGIDHLRLEKLYVDQALSIAEVAEKFRITPPEWPRSS
jgi:hypothetical protein